MEEYDRAPTLWQTNNNGRPWRVTAAGVYELPFGPGKPFLNNRGVLVEHRPRVDSLAARSNTSRASCSTGTTSSSPATWPTSRRTNPEIALLPDGTFDPTKTWFNIDAGFEQATADQPAAFQKRAFPFRVDGRSRVQTCRT